MKEVERVGLLKMDFLGLSTLTLIDDCARGNQAHRGRSTLDIDAVPLDDEKTYKLFADGQTYGVFQFESSGMRELLRKAKPERLDDLIALNALYRPGPLKSGMVDDFIARKQGKTEVKYELPALAPILSDTYGVIAYQEQVMRIAAVLAGFSMGQSDVLRKAMGKKDPKVMAKQREAFMQGALAKGVNEKKAKKIFDLMEFFAGYGFNKSHSTTYALLAYQTAYLKANFPRHFMAALLTIEAANTDKLAMYLGECRDLQIPILPPDINSSQLAFTVEPDGVRFGLCAVKNVGEGAIESMLAVRQERGPNRLAVHPLRTRRSATRQQAAAREPGQGGRVRLARRRSALHTAGRGCSSRSTRRLSTAAVTSETAKMARVSFFDLTAGWRGARRDSVAGGFPLDRGAAARLREGGARPLHERASARALQRRPESVRRPAGRGSHRIDGRRVGRRHRQRPAPVENQEGRPHGGVRPRRHRRRHRGRGVPGDLRQARRTDRGGRDGAGPRKVREGRGIRPPGRDRAPRHRRRSASGRRAKSPSICRCRRTADRRFEALAELFSRHRGDRKVSLELDVRGQPPAVARSCRCGAARSSFRATGRRSRADLRLGIGVLR